MSLAPPQKISIKDTRDQLAHLIEQVAIAKKKYIITKFGKPKAMITPIISQISVRKKLSGLEATFGLWKNRKDIKNSTRWVSRTRKKWSHRVR